MSGLRTFGYYSRAYKVLYAALLISVTVLGLVFHPEGNKVGFGLQVKNATDQHLILPLLFTLAAVISLVQLAGRSKIEINNGYVFQWNWLGKLVFLCPVRELRPVSSRFRIRYSGPNSDLSFCSWITPLATLQELLADDQEVAPRQDVPETKDTKVFWGFKAEFLPGIVDMAISFWCLSLALGNHTATGSWVKAVPFGFLGLLGIELTGSGVLRRKLTPDSYIELNAFGQLLRSVPYDRIREIRKPYGCHEPKVITDFGNFRLPYNDDLLQALEARTGLTAGPRADAVPQGVQVARE